MGNMGYCRFRNTLKDLFDCQEHLSDKEEELGEDEEEARNRLIELCCEIAEEFKDEVFD